MQTQTEISSNLQIQHEMKAYRQQSEAAGSPRNNVKPGQRHGLLHQAVIRGNLGEVIIALSQTPEDLNQPTVNNLTPLHLAVFGYAQSYGSREWQTAQLQRRKLNAEVIVDYLIDAGAKVAVWDKMGRLPAACAEGAKIPDSLLQAMEEVREVTSIGCDESDLDPKGKRQDPFQATGGACFKGRKAFA